MAAISAAQARFAGFPPGQWREYVEWMASTKRPGTREKRLDMTIAQLSDGKRLNWKYERR